MSKKNKYLKKMVGNDMNIDGVKITKKQLEEYAMDNENAHFIETDKGRLVVFNPDRFVWNAYGKESIDTENQLTDDEWLDFKSNEDYMYLELEYTFSDELDAYIEENKIRSDEVDENT